jgi:hypothetical protein
MTLSWELLSSVGDSPETLLGDIVRQPLTTAN